ncbi:MAG: Cof-type HAD-IIB family hydrolase [Marinifilaceae bacterium]
MKSEYKVVILDLDGTLTNSKKELSPRNKQALIEAQKQGARVVLASGRPTYGIVPLAKELQLANYGGYILSYNGGQIIDCSTGENMYHTSLPTSLISELYKEAKAGNGTMLSYQDRFIVTEDSTNEYVCKEAFLNRMDIEEIGFFPDAIKTPVTKCLAVGHPEEMARLELVMKAKFGETINVFRSEPYFVELVPQNIDKAYSLGILAQHLGITADDMIAFGDGFNDLSMIEFAGTGVAMANAQDAVKSAADLVTLTNDEDGVAYIVEQLRFSVN